MIPSLCSFIPFFGHGKCKQEISNLIQIGLDDNKEIHSLNVQILELLNQIQELKAIYDYQSLKFENTIDELKLKLKSSRKKRPMRRKQVTVTKASDGNMVEIISFQKDMPNE